MRVCDTCGRISPIDATTSGSSAGPPPLAAAATGSAACVAADDAAGALLDPACDTLSWTPNFTAAANEDHKGYAALLSDVAAVLRGEDRDVPDIGDGVRAMERLERMIGQIGL